MTTQDLLDYYSGLLVLQYRNKLNAAATVQAFVKGLIMDQMPIAVRNGFSLTSAVGVQLDIIGKYSNVTRFGYGGGGPITLADADFRKLIQLAIIKDSSGSSLATIQSLLATYFPNQIYVYDYANMHMSYLVNTSVGSLSLVQLFVSEGLLPKPMGVQLGSVIYAADVTHFFGMRTYHVPAYNVSPFNTYGAYTTGTPFLSYANAVAP